MRRLIKSWKDRLGRIGVGREEKDRGRKGPRQRGLRLEPLEERQLLTVVTVNDLSDPSTYDTNDSVISLREVIETATSGDVITFESSLSDETISLSGQLDITCDLTVTSLGSERAFVSWLDDMKASCYSQFPLTACRINFLGISHRPCLGAVCEVSETFTVARSSV